ncbi:MAG: phage portal protein, partial [Lachnospiraceae bacterium]|nr:phage portal protein [Lachnospiraceae bacterium]
QGIEEGVKSAASFRFMAKVNNFSKITDLANERKRFTEDNFAKDGGGILLFPNTYTDIKQVDAKPWVIDAEQMAVIQKNVFEYFGVNEEVLMNKAFGDAWSAFYEGAIEPFAIQFSDVMTRMLFTLREQSQGNQVIASSNRLQYLSNKEKLNVSSQMLDRGIMSINDVREIWNLPPVEGGDARIIRGEYYNADEKVTEVEDDERNQSV